LGVRVTRTAQAISDAGHPPAELRTTARVRLEQLDGGFSITKIELSTAGAVQGVDESEFVALAEQAKATCPVSRALAGTEITVEAKLLAD
jgi:lipoyl-dependent peroxiredoxin